MGDEKSITLENCVAGTADYDHAGAVKELYEHLNRLGNSLPWQLCILEILFEGIQEKIYEEERLRASLAEQLKREEKGEPLEEEDGYSIRINNIHKRIMERAGIEEENKFHLFYSACPYDENDLPIDNLDEIAVHGRVRFFQCRDEYWGGFGGKDFESDTLEDPTWLTVAVLANQMITCVRDFHHQFLEGVRDTKERDEFGVPIYEFSMGS